MAMIAFRPRNAGRGFRVGRGVARAAYGAMRHLYKNREALRVAAKKLWYKKNKVIQKPARRIGSLASAPAPSQEMFNGPWATINDRGGYNQWAQFKKSVGKKVPRAVVDKRINRASQEPWIMGFRNLKEFSGFGALPLQTTVAVDGGVTSALPFYAFLLNGRTSRTAGQVDMIPRPARRLEMAYNGQLSWQAVGGLTADGAGSYEQQTFVVPSPIGTTSAANTLATRRMYHEWVNVKMNLWGAKAKPVKYTIQLVKVLDDEINPWHYEENIAILTPAQQAYEELLKQYTYNPLARIDHNIKKSFKVLKTWTVNIDPTSTTESDADPHVKTLNVFYRVNKVTNYDKVSQNSEGELRIDQVTELKNAVDEAAKQSQPYNHLPRDKEALLLFVRATEYSPSQNAFDNALHASFDIDMRTKFIVSQ